MYTRISVSITIALVFILVSSTSIRGRASVAPNEFNEDDLMAMEKAVERTVRISLDEIGLDPDDLKLANSIQERRII